MRPQDSSLCFQSRQFAIERVGERRKVGTQCVQPRPEPDHVQCALAAFELADLALGDTEAVCQRGLVQLRVTPRLYQQALKGRLLPEPQGRPQALCSGLEPLRLS